MIFDSQLIFIQRISPIPFYIFLLMNQNSCFITAKIILIPFKNFRQPKFFCFFCTTWMINVLICALFQKQLAVEDGKSKRPQIWTSHAGAIQGIVILGSCQIGRRMRCSMSFSESSSPSIVSNSSSQGPKLKKLKEIFVIDSTG